MSQTVVEQLPNRLGSATNVCEAIHAMMLQLHLTVKIGLSIALHYRLICLQWKQMSLPSWNQLQRQDLVQYKEM